MINASESYTLRTPEQAEAVAAAMQADDDDSGWRYVAKHDPTGRGLSFVEMYDDEGHYVGRL